METAVEGTGSLKQIGVHTDTRDILAHAKQQAEKRNYQDYVIVDVDSHHTEVASWQEVMEYVEDPVVRADGMEYHSKVSSPPYGLHNDIAYYQDVGGRIQHQTGWREPVGDPEVHRDVILSRRAMESFGVDYRVVFPTRMLHLGMHPQPEMEVLMGRAYNRWMVEKVLGADDRIKSLLYLPFSVPEAALRTVEELSDKPGVIGFLVTSTRNKPVHDNLYMKLYATLEERQKPLAFHGGYHWDEPSISQLNRFVGMHALGFVLWNLIHMTNWVLNGIPERFPNLKVIWIESGLAWVPFLMQRLDNEYLKRVSEAPLLKRRPSEYMREMFYTSHPLETTNSKALELTFEMINAETQVLYASDWPHWDFDVPSTLFDLPFLSERARRNILGESALKLFKLARPKGK